MRQAAAERFAAYVAWRERRRWCEENKRRRMPDDDLAKAIKFAIGVARGEYPKAGAVGAERVRYLLSHPSGIKDDPRGLALI
jgi:hypothetical protein